MRKPWGCIRWPEYILPRAVALLYPYRVRAQQAGPRTRQDRMQYSSSRPDAMAIDTKGSLPFVLQQVSIIISYSLSQWLIVVVIRRVVVRESEIVH